MKPRLVASVLLVAWVISTGWVAGGRSFAAEPDSAAQRKEGRTIYMTFCQRCHGVDGSDTTLYLGAKSLVDVTQRYDAREVIEKSKGFAAADLNGARGDALYAHLATFRSGKWAAPELLVETSWVAKHLRKTGMRLVDMRSEQAYAAGHIPGSVRIAAGPLRDPADDQDFLPNPDAFAGMMSRAGIGLGTHVVIYDDQGGRSAARLWFVLNAYGHERVSLVNGGWLKWVDEKRETTMEVVPPQPSGFKPKKVPEMVCAVPQLLARKPDVVLLDTRSAAEFKGDQVSGGVKKAGRIPNSVNVDWRETVTGPFQVFKSGPELKKLYESKGVTPDNEVVTY